MLKEHKNNKYIIVIKNNNSKNYNNVHLNQ